MQYRLTPKETVDLWNRGIVPDAEKGELCLYTIVDTEENLAIQTNLRIEIDLADRDEFDRGNSWYHSFRVFSFSENCLSWIAENTDIQWEMMDSVLEQREDLSSIYS